MIDVEVSRHGDMGRGSGVVIFCVNWKLGYADVQCRLGLSVLADGDWMCGDEFFSKADCIPTSTVLSGNLGQTAKGIGITEVASVGDGGSATQSA